MVEEEEGVTEFVPLEGEEEGEGNFLGNICSQYSLGNLEPCERTRIARRVKSKQWCFQEAFMIVCVVSVLVSNVMRL